MTDWVENRQELPGGGSMRSRGRQALLPGGRLWWIEQDVRVRGVHSGPFPMGAGWIIEFIELRRGSLSFRQDGRKILAPGRQFVWVLPAFCVVHAEFRHAAFRFVAVAARSTAGDVPAAARAYASRVFPLRGKLPANTAQLLARLASLGEGISVEISSTLPPLVRAAKTRLEQGYHQTPSIAGLARSLGISHAHLTREFRRCLGMSPLRYVHNLRSMEAASRLSTGESVVDTSLEVGYNDLSRFYKQFRKLGCSSPGRYRRR